MTDDEDDDIRVILARIERGQAEIRHDVDRLRADLAIMTSRQNSTILDTKKKRTASLSSSRSSWIGW